jgi:hypothetical protein
VCACVRACVYACACVSVCVCVVCVLCVMALVTHPRELASFLNQSSAERLLTREHVLDETLRGLRRDIQRAHAMHTARRHDVSALAVTAARLSRKEGWERARAWLHFSACSTHAERCVLHCQHRDRLHGVRLSPRPNQRQHG